jgi:hypothetical protein
MLVVGIMLSNWLIHFVDINIAIRMPHAPSAKGTKHGHAHGPNLAIKVREFFADSVCSTGAPLHLSHKGVSHEYR